MSSTRNMWHTCPRLAYVSSPGIRVLTWRMCLRLAYVSSPGIRVLAWHTCPHLASTGVCVLNKRTCPHLANVSSPSTSPSPLGYAHKKSCTYHPVFKSNKSLDGDRGMDRCHYALLFKGISIRSTPEIVLSSKRN